jgi:hypothetical protein
MKKWKKMQEKFQLGIGNFLKIVRSDFGISCEIFRMRLFQIDLAI